MVSATTEQLPSVIHMLIGRQVLSQRKLILERKLLIETIRGIAEAKERQAALAGEIASVFERRPSKLGTGEKDGERAFLARLEEVGQCRVSKDRCFAAYLKRMGRVLYRCGKFEGVLNDCVFAAAVLSHVSTEYSLLKKIGISPEWIGKNGHRISVWEADRIRCEVQDVFGCSEKRAKLEKTAFMMVLGGKYADARAAMLGYMGFLNEAQWVFGTDKIGKSLVKTVAYLMFRGKCKAAKDAKEKYKMHLKGAGKVFGADAESAPLVRTAANLVFRKVYASIEDAKRRYDECLKQATEVFGAHKESAPLVRTAATRLFTNKGATVEKEGKRYLGCLAQAKKLCKGIGEDDDIARTVAHMVFVGKYKTVEEAGSAHARCLREARMEFGMDLECAPLARTAAALVFRKVYASMEDAKGKYEECLRQAKRFFHENSDGPNVCRYAAYLVFCGKYESVEKVKEEYELRLSKKNDAIRKRQVGNVGMPVLAGLERDEALMRLMPISKTIGKNFRFSNLGERDAQATSLLIMLEMLEEGHRDAVKIVDSAIAETRKQAAEFSRRGVSKFDEKFMLNKAEAP